MPNAHRFGFAVPVLSAALLAVVVWGASPVATKIAVFDLPPLAVAVLRTVVGGLAALVLGLSLRLPLPERGGQRRVLVLSSMCGFVAFPAVFSIGMAHTSANHASIILAALPIFTGAIALAWDRRWPKRLWWAGCAVALAGEFLLIVSGPSMGADGATLGGDFLILGGNVFASLGYVAGGRLQRDGYPSTGTTFWGAGLAALVLLPAVPFVMGGVELAGVATVAWLGVLYLAIGVTIVGYLLWYWALGKGGIERIGLIQFLQPVSGVLLAWLLLGEQLTLGFLAATGIVLLGVWIALQANDS